MTGWMKAALGVLGVIVLLAALIVGASAGVKAYSRYQRRADVHNEITVRHTQVAIAKQDVAIAQQQAQVRVAQAIGIRDAQDHISKTLTPLYVQWEAIQAQIAMAKTGNNHTQVYVPVGNNGVPLVYNAPDGQVK